ncbi:hypothetical protein KM92DES2_10219 [uncultured Desulfovibrio sp.]|uniref:Uncharacterized protein n=1 Tax=uncultured Desulfovibrio sp. TaxID=167968 RepID=A0A212IY87_9BACT|nr:hypothetical protein KM92DES2_10219 [uncultured Desulfovibrio sp.]
MKAGLPACLPLFGLPGFIQWHTRKSGVEQAHGGGSAPDFHGDSLLSSMALSMSRKSQKNCTLSINTRKKALLVP